MKGKASLSATTSSSGSTSELSIAKKAVTYGVKVWATPWTPPAKFKSNNNNVMGTLTKPADYAQYLVGFVKTMKNNGVDIYAISAQNEPDAKVETTAALAEKLAQRSDSVAFFAVSAVGRTDEREGTMRPATDLEPRGYDGLFRWLLARRLARRRLQEVHRRYLR